MNLCQLDQPNNNAMGGVFPGGPARQTETISIGSSVSLLGRPNRSLKCQVIEGVALPFRAPSRGLSFTRSK